MSTSGGSGFDSLVSGFQWNEKIIKYITRERTNPHGKSWIKAKRIVAVTNVDVIHFLVVEILHEEGKIKVYDCKLPAFVEAIFLPTYYHCWSCTLTC